MGGFLYVHPQATSRLLDPSNPLYGVASDGQRTLALIAEMIHTSSLLHDDVIDEATTRRNKDSVNAVFGDTQAIYAGDYILAKVRRGGDLILCYAGMMAPHVTLL